jgi:RHS repeat-associated protein
MYSILNKNTGHTNRKMGKWLLLLFIFGTTANAKAQNLNNPNKQGPLGTQVNTLTGNLYIPRADIYIPAIAFDLDIAFHYNSYSFQEDYGYGKGWTFEYNIKYSRDTTPGARLILWGDGREDKYDSLTSTTYKSPRGFFNTLKQYQPNKYVLTELDSVKYFFDNAIHKKITRMQEPNGNFINFNYTDSLLTAITNNAGQSIGFTYNAQGRLATVVDAIANPTRTFTYTYDGLGNLKEVKDPLNGKYQYTYLTSGPMKSLADKNNNKVDIIYFPDLSISEIIGCNKRISFSYDTTSNTTVVTDHLSAGNQVTTFNYKKVEGESWITSVTGNCCGYNLSYEYDDQGNQIKMTDANGQLYEYTYDALGNMLTAKDPLNQITTYTYTNDFKKIKSFKDPKGNMYNFNYDGYGNMTQLISPNNNIYNATYNSTGDITSSSDSKGNMFTYNYDVYGNLLNVTGPNGYYATLTHDARGRLLAYTDAMGNNATAEYDLLDRLKKITDPINNHSQFNYDAQGNMVSFINENNETSIMNYDASNRVVNGTGPTGNQTTFTYDGMNNMTAVKNALGHETKMSYDNRNRMSGTTDAEGNNAAYNYDGNGNVTSVNLPNGRSINYTYDGLNRVTAVSDATGTIGSFAYDKNNNITSYVNGTGAITTAAYDSLDRMKEITDPLGNKAFFTYDKNDNIVSLRDREGRISYFTYDSLDRRKTYTDNNGFITTIGYDAQSNITTLTDQNSNTTSYIYDSLNRRKTMTYPDGKFMQYSYDKKSNITSIRLTDATNITYQYDTLNRVVSRTLPGGEVYSFTYDKLNRVLYATNNSGTASFTYDNLNRVKSETFDGRTTRYNYNIAGRTQTLIYPDSTTVIKEFDTRNRITKILKDSIVVAEYVYNNADQAIAKNLANGVTSTMQYDFANRLSSISTLNGTIQNTTFTYDKDKNKTSINRLNNPGLSEQFTYDNGYRLTNYKRGIVGSPTIQNTYTYDAVGNRTAANLNGIATTYSKNNMNQTTGVNSTSFTFDNRGNITFDGLFYKTYDAENRLKKDSSSPTSVLTYAHDAIGRRITKTINGNTLKYTYSGAAQIEERNSSNALLNRTVFTNFLSPVMNEKAGSKYYYHQNELGSVEAITNDGGRLIESYRYDVYGMPTRYDSLSNPLASSIAGNRVGFTGQEYDSASGSYRFFFRNYSPTTGVFSQRDLIEYEDGMGMYQYVGNNPANGVDIWGLRGSYESLIPDPADLDRVYKEGGGIKSLNELVSSLLSKTNFGLGLIDRYEGVITTKSKEIIQGVIKCGNNTKKIILRTRKNAWAIALLGKKYAKGYLNDAADGVTKFSKIAAREATSAGKLAKAGLKGLGEFTGIAEVGFKIGKLGAELGNGISPAGQSEWKATGDAALSILGILNPKNLGKKAIAAIGAGKLAGLLDFGMETSTGKTILDHLGDGAYNGFLIMYTDETTVLKHTIDESFFKKCPPPGGNKKPRPKGPGTNGPMFVFEPIDPNELIGPIGEPNKQWVSVKDRMPYTILCENDTTATARTRYIKITTPVEPKQDAATLELGSFGFNNQSFTIPTGTSSYYQRLDTRDSTGVYVDITAGYDVLNNQIFWEFQALDPLTLMPPEDPLAGFLFLQDTSKPEYGNGFVNFSIKPKQSAITLDTIVAKAFIVFDENAVIPTNLHKNTIDAFAPTSHMNNLAPTSNNPIALSWTGADDVNGCGIRFYTLYVSTDGTNFSILKTGITRTDTTITVAQGSSYYFFVLATDSVGNMETLRAGEVKNTFIGGVLPISLLSFNGKTVEKDNILEWSTSSEQNSKSFEVERSFTGNNFSKIANVNAAGNSSTQKNYEYTDAKIDKLNSTVMYYRLKQIDLDNSFKYSNIVRLNYNDKKVVPSIVYPNPTQGIISISFGDASVLGTLAILSDANGRLLQQIKITANTQSFDLSGYTNGIYFIQLKNKEVLKIIKQ